MCLFLHQVKGCHLNSVKVRLRVETGSSHQNQSSFIHREFWLLWEKPETGSEDVSKSGMSHSEVFIEAYRRMNETNRTCLQYWMSTNSTFDFLLINRNRFCFWLLYRLGLIYLAGHVTVINRVWISPNLNLPWNTKYLFYSRLVLKMTVVLLISFWNEWKVFSIQSKFVKVKTHLSTLHYLPLLLPPGGTHV